MTQLPNYQVTANPISNFETFGEAAPSAPATVEGMLAPPIDTYTPTMRLLGQLSNTLTSFFNEEKVKENELAFQSSEASAMEKRPEILALAAARDGNMLKYADLVDKGLITQDENPWAAAGAKRALAKMNAQLIRDNRNQNLTSDFRNNADNISSAADPTIAVATYMSSRTNPLGLSEDILQDHYYMINFEQEFSRVRQQTTDDVIKLRNSKERQDIINSIGAEVNAVMDDASSARQVTEEMFGPMSPKFFKERLDAISDDEDFISRLGEDGVRSAVNMFLIERAALGDVSSILTLDNRDIKDADLRLKADKVIADYDQAEEASAEKRAVEISTNLAGARVADIVLDDEDETVTTRISALLADKGLRAALGSNGLRDYVGEYAIQLGLQGNTEYMAILNAPLSNGTTLLDSPKVKALYGLKKNDIDRATAEKFNVNTKAANAEISKVVDAALLEAFSHNPLATDEQIFNDAKAGAEQADGRLIFDYNPARQELKILQYYSDGEPYFKTITTDSIRRTALKNRFEGRKNEIRKQQYKIDPENTAGVQMESIEVAAAVESMKRDNGYIDEDLRNRVKRGFDLATGGETIEEEDLPAIQSTLSLYRAMKNSGNTSLMSGYFSGKGENEFFYFLDILEKGNQGSGMGDLPLGSGSLQGALSKLNTVGNIETGILDSQAFREYEAELETQIREAGYDSLTGNLLLQMGRVRYKLGGAGDPSEAASDIMNNFVESGQHFTYITTNTKFNPDEAPALFDGVIEDLRISVGTRREELLKSPLSATVNEFVIQQSGASDNTDDKYIEFLDRVKFIGKHDGTFIITSGPSHSSLESFNIDQFREDQLNRASLVRPVTGSSLINFKLPVSPETKLPRDPVTLEEKLKSEMSERMSRSLNLGPDGQYEGP